MIFVIVVLIRYRENVMLALTGDTHIHANILDCLWSTLRCCGTCTGDWTRRFTSSSCCPVALHCGCCTLNVKNKNIVKEFGRLIGFATHDVEFKNITVGDLPFPTRGDFYLTVECSSNPDQVTSLREDADPKVVHFPEVLTMRMRKSWLENKVMIKVRELNVLGSQELCELRISAMNVIDWREE